jgi:hypothetical protein
MEFNRATGAVATKLASIESRASVKKMSFMVEISKT